VSATGSRPVAVLSAGRLLVVEAPLTLPAWWPEIAPHLPGTAADVVPSRLPAALTGVARVPDGLGPQDVRRWLGARLHQMHLEYGTLCVHAVSLCSPDGGGAVLLLGGHGAGKTLVALALARSGWRVLAGDVTLLDCTGPTPAVLGGTTAMLARRAPTHRWFPDLRLDSSGPPIADLGGRAELAVAAPKQPVPVSAVVVTDVDRDPAAGDGAVELLDEHVVATVWLRASGHLLDRLIAHDRDAMPLRSLEDAPAARHRLGLIHALTKALPVHALWGSPHAIAVRAARLAVDHAEESHDALR
jgi:hypothetical protein